ncbi:hypothetical protein LTR40_012546, partial [Exophiala xenobiotica]
TSCDIIQVVRAVTNANLGFHQKDQSSLRAEARDPKHPQHRIGMALPRARLVPEELCQRRREYVTQHQHGGRQPQPHPQPKAQALGEQGMFLEEEGYPVRPARSAVNQEVKLSGEGQQRPQTSPDQGRGAKQQEKKPKLAKVLKWLTL